MKSILQQQLAPLVARYGKFTAPTEPTTAVKDRIANAKPSLYKLAVLDQLRADVEVWQSSPQGQERLAHARIAGLGAWTRLLKELATGPATARTRKVANAQTAGDDDPPIQAVSIAFEAQATAGLGANGSIGVAFDPEDPSGNMVVFVSIAAVEGGAGIASGTQCGVWTCPPVGLGGISFGASATVVVKAGFELAVSVSTSGVGFMLTLGAGLQAGFALMQWFTSILWSSASDPRPVKQPPGQHFLIFTKLWCQKISGGDGDNNEVYFEFSPNDIYWYRNPTWGYFPMHEGQTWLCGRSAYLDEWIDINLYDVDDTSGDDLLGSIRINLSQLQVGVDRSFDIASSNWPDERLYTIVARLIY